MAIYDFITSLRVRANKRGLTYTTRLYTGNKPTIDGSSSRTK